MKQMILTAPYTFEANETDIPSYSDDQVLLKVEQVGICGSDSQMYHGLHKYMTFPVITGHEASCVIAEMGKNVTGFRKGERVTVEPQVFCGECTPCKIGRFNVCEHLKVMGVHQNGFCQEYVAIDPSFLHSCDGLSTDQTALIEPLAVGVGSARRAGGLKGKNVVVVGAGTIGNLTAQAAKAFGAEKIMITDREQSKLDLAVSCGLECAVNTAEISLKEAILKHFGDRKADVIIDCVGVPQAFDEILKAARPASTIVITGNYKVPLNIEMPILQRQEISLLGHMMYVREDFHDAIRFVREKMVKIDGFATQHFKLDEAPKAFKFIDENPKDVLRAMLVL